MCHEQCRAGDKMDKIIISMASATLANPTMPAKSNWNLPNPRASMASPTV